LKIKRLEDALQKLRDGLAKAKLLEGENEAFEG
jgi:hypothetical protein